MLNGGGRKAPAYLFEQAISNFPLSNGNPDLDQLMALEAEIQFMHDIFGESRLTDHHYRPHAMGRCREHPPVRRCKCQHEFSGKASF
jgi:hypothetical protein